MKRKLLSIFIALVLALSLCLVTAVSVAAAVINVNPGESIQAAIDGAGPDDIISVAAGTYVGDLTIPAGKENLELVGATGATIKGVNVLEWPTHTTAISVLASGVKIHGFTIESPDYSGAFGNPHSSGITVGVANVEIYDNIFSATDVGDTLYWCTMIETYGAWVGDVSGLNIHDNTFTSTTGIDKGSEGIYINYNSENSNPSGYVTIANNTFGGQIFRAITSERDKTTISGNTISSSYAPGAAFNAAYLGVSISSPVANLNPNQDTVVMIGNTINGFNEGIRLGTPGDALNYNILTNISLANNTVETNTVGIKVRSSAGGVVVNNNSIIDNTGCGVENADSATLDATSNWWGTTVEAEIAAMISGLVNYTLWLEAAPSSVEMTAQGEDAISPTVTTSDATAVAFTLATLNGDLTDMGTAEWVDVSFVYGTTQGSPTLETTPVRVTTTGTFLAPIGTLAAGTTYYFQAKAQGSDVLDPVYGIELSFTTAVVTTLAATNIGAYTATLNGQLDIGSATSVDVSFEWGESIPYSFTTTPFPMNASGDFSAELSGLAVNVLHHFQALGDISTDTGYGGDMQFTTAARIGISVSPTYIDFGAVTAGHASPIRTVTVTNTGDYNEIFDAELLNQLPVDFYTDNLAIDAGTVALWTTAEIIPTGYVEPELVLSIPIGAGAGAKTATLIFWAMAGAYP